MACLVNGGVVAVCCVLVMVWFAVGWLAAVLGLVFVGLFVVCVRWGGVVNSVVKFLFFVIFRYVVLYVCLNV